MPPHNPLSPVTTRTPPPPPPSTSLQQHSIGKNSVQPAPISARTPPRPPTSAAGLHEDKSTAQVYSPRTQPQPQQPHAPLSTRIPPPSPPELEKQRAMNASGPGTPQRPTGMASPAIKVPPRPGNPYQGKQQSPPMQRKLSLSSSVGVASPVIASSSPNMFSPAVSSPQVIASKRPPPPVPSIGTTPTVSSPAVFSPPTTSTPLRGRSVTGNAPTPPRQAAPPPPAARILQSKPLASSAPMFTRSPYVAASPLVSSSPAVAASPVMASSPMVVGTPNIMSPPVPVRPARKLTGTSTPNYESGGEDYDKIKKAREALNVLSKSANTPVSTPPYPQPNSLKASVGVGRHDLHNSNGGDNVNHNSNNGEHNDAMNRLKRQTHLLKSPLVKDYLLNSSLLATGSQSAHSSPVTPRRSTTVRRSITPPPTRPGDDSPSRPRKLSDPVPMNCNYEQRRAELLGSEDGISRPYNVTHTTHIDLRNFALLADDSNHALLSQSNLLASSNEKSGFLYKLGTTFQERWVVCKRNTLTYYKKKGDTKPRGEIYLGDVEFLRDKTCKRPHTLHLSLISTKRHYYFSAMTEEVMEEWVRVLHTGGAVDKDIISNEKAIREREKKAEDAKLAREARKKENDYVKEKIKKRSTLKLSNKNMPDSAMKECACDMRVTEAKMSEGRIVFRVDITFDDQKWSIFRKYDKVAALYNATVKLKFVKGMCPPRKAPSGVSESEFSKQQVSKLQEMLSALAQNRSQVFNSSSAKQGYLRFIAPVGWDDVKPEEFIMPFAFDF